MRLPMKKNMTLLLAGLLLTGCSTEKKIDAYGNFEAVEIMVSAEANGKLLTFNLQEGQVIEAGQLAAAVDSTLPALQKQELQARQQSIRSRTASADAQIGVVQQQLENLQVDLERVQNMLNDEAATQKQLDDLIGAEKILKKQLTAARAQRGAVAAEGQALEAKLALINEQLLRCRVYNPVAGTVLEKYSEAGEMTAAGRPLYKIAGLTELILRVYVSGGQLSALKIGQPCIVRIDADTKYINLSGRITWISDTAEFTPKIIQTKEERINLVYAVKVCVPNPDGLIKIGMPGEVIFQSPQNN